MDVEKDLEAVRDRMRRIDQELVALAAERVKLARRVGEIKRAQNKPTIDYGQERIVLDRAKGAIAIPSAGVRSGPGGTSFVWVIAGGRVERRPVTVGMRDELLDLSEVKSGLQAGDAVVVSPVEGLAPGQPVQITDAPAAGKATGAAVAPKAGAKRQEK